MLTTERNAVLLEVGELLRGLQQRSSDADTVLTELTSSAAKCVPGAEFAGITLVGRKGKIQTIAPTHRYVADLDDVQRRHRQGPCLAACARHEVIRIDDLAEDRRWPRYRVDALALTPVRSVLSVQLFTEPQRTGALNFYAEATGRFDDDSVELALVFATHTALVWNLVRRNEEFQSALATRDIIGQAKGIVMERFNIDAVDAFELLKKLSQSSNTPVADIARRLVRENHPTR